MWLDALRLTPRLGLDKPPDRLANTIPLKVFIMNESGDTNAAL